MTDLRHIDWTAEMDADLIHRRAGNDLWRELAVHFGVTPETVKRRARRIGVDTKRMLVVNALPGPTMTRGSVWTWAYECGLRRPAQHPQTVTAQPLVFDEPADVDWVAVADWASRYAPLALYKDSAAAKLRAINAVRIALMLPAFRVAAWTARAA